MDCDEGVSVCCRCALWEQQVRGLLLRLSTMCVSISISICVCVCVNVCHWV